MATTPTTAPAVPQPAAPATSGAAISTPALITAMVKFNAKVSDLIISPHRPPQVELGGQLVVVPGLPVLSAQDTARLAARSEERRVGKERSMWWAKGNGT